MSSSGYSGGGGGLNGGGGVGGSDFFTGGGGFTGRLSSSSSIAMNNTTQLPQQYRSQLSSGVILDPSSQINNRRPDLIGKRTLAEFQTQNLHHHHQQQQHQHQHQQQNQNQHHLQNKLFSHPQQNQQQQLLGMYLRSVKPRIYQNTSPISPLSPVDFSGSIFPDSSNSSGRYGIPIIQQLRSQKQMMNLGNQQRLSNVSFPNLMNQSRPTETESEKKMMNQLQEIEKQLLDDDDDGGDEHCEDVSVITGSSEWSEMQSLFTSPNNQKPPISTSPTTSSSSSISTSSSVAACSKQLVMEAATAISEGKIEAAAEIITRLSQGGSNPQGSAEQRLVFYMTAALKSRVTPTENPPPISELFGKEQSESTQLLIQHSSAFKFGLMAANFAIIEATAEDETFHVVDFNVGRGLQYQYLLQFLSMRKSGNPKLVKITAVEGVVNGGDEERSMTVEEELSKLGKQVGISVQFKTVLGKISDLSRESLGCESDEVVVVNLAYTLSRMADESVTTENPRDKLLQRVKVLQPRVTTVVEQEMNCNTAQFGSRVNECCIYYGALFDSLDSSMATAAERVKIEEGLSRKMGNSVACEGRDRVERCEMFGKWRARMCMAGFQLKPVSQHDTESLKTKINSGTRVNPGFSVKEENGGACFSWMGRTLTVASAWR